ncbi:MAG: redoxin domain-containing protein [Eubacteriales bacterium]|nr:redoxin domain-containing protein [Eubacteriales bacterium]
MRMKKWGFLVFILVLALGLSGFSTAFAQQSADVYKLGDKVEDFTVTLSDGREVSLYGLLAEKKAVMLNFWASWCGPCGREFPYLQEAYDQLSDEVGVIALSIFNGDSNEEIEAFKPDHGVTTLPMGRDIGLAARYGVSCYPTTFIIDRNGVICMIHDAAFSSTRLLTNALSTFLADDYTEPVLLSELPPIPMTEAPGSEELSKALNAEGGALTFTSLLNDESLWPFVPSENGASVVASNVDVQNSVSNVVLEADVKAGDVLTFDCRLNGASYDDRLLVFVDNEPKVLESGSFDWKTLSLRFETEGKHGVAFAYTRGSAAGYEAVCELRDARLLTGDEAAAWEIPALDGPKTLSGAELAIDILTEGVQAAHTVDADNQVADAETVLYITNTPTLSVKLRIGADVDETFAAVAITRDLQNQQTIMLRDLEHDDEGYFLTTELQASQVGTFLTLKANALDSAAPSLDSIFCISKDDAKSHMNITIAMLTGRLSDEEIQQIGYFGLSCDGETAFYTSEDLLAYLAAYKAQTAAKEEPAATPVYTITFTDEQGQPIQNVMAQICDETTCTVLPSDENGVVRFEGESAAYDLHVLMVPSGYQRPEETFTLPENGGDLAVTLEALVP